MSRSKSSYVIRASSAPDHQDCPRRWAANNIKGFLVSTGDGGEAAVNVGALLGDCCHAGAQMMLASKAESGEWDLDAAIAHAFELLAVAFKGYVKMDRLTSSRGDAQVQIRSMLGVFARDFMPKAQPRFIELATRCTIDSGHILSGHLDYVEEIEPGVWAIYDHKFGGKLSPYHSQMGLYHILLTSQKWFTGRVEKLILNFIARPGLKRKGGFIQAPLVQVEYVIEACLEAGLKQIREIVKERAEFLDTGSPWAFNANNRSSLCTKKYCRAWGSEACDMWTDLGEDDNDESDLTDS